MKTILWVFLGMIIMYVLLKVLAGRGETSNVTTTLTALARTPQVGNLVLTNEFREVIKTQEFRRFAAALAEDQLKVVSQTLVGTTTNVL
jgi:hypothetical protein